MSQTIEDSKNNPTENNCYCAAAQMVVNEKILEMPVHGKSVKVIEIYDNKIEIPAHDGILKSTGELLNTNNERIAIFPVNKVKDFFQKIMRSFIGREKDR